MRRAGRLAGPKRRGPRIFFRFALQKLTAAMGYGPRGCRLQLCLKKGRLIVHRFPIHPSAIWFSLALAAVALGQTSAPQQASQPAVSPAPNQTQTTDLPEIGPDQSWSFELFYWLTQAHPD
jgi:hypothetical protein